MSTGTERTHTAETVTVNVQWHETVRYEATIQVSRAEYERMRTLFVGDKDDEKELEAELMCNHNLTRTEGTDWDDLELDVFHEAAKEEPQDDIKF